MHAAINLRLRPVHYHALCMLEPQYSLGCMRWNENMNPRTIIHYFDRIHVTQSTAVSGHFPVRFLQLISPEYLLQSYIVCMNTSNRSNKLNPQPTSPTSVQATVRKIDFSLLISSVSHLEITRQRRNSCSMQQPNKLTPEFLIGLDTKSVLCER